MALTGNTLLDRRVIEAQTMAAVFKELCTSHGREQALHVLNQTIASMAAAAGRDFAAQAPDGPNFDHFKTIVTVWRGSGALTINNVRETDNTLSFDVSRCLYVELYHELALPQDLVEILSCNRDAPFTLGYSPRIHFSRESTIAEGAPKCDFSFKWLT